MANERTDPTAGDAGRRPGGYHSLGVPGEEAALPKSMRVLRVNDLGGTIPHTQPTKGGMHADSTAAGLYEDALAGGADAPGGKRGLYVLALRGPAELEVPIFEAGQGADRESVAVFTDRNAALAFLQTARWEDSHTFADLPPSALALFFQQARREGIDRVLVNPNRLAQLRGELQSALDLDAQADLSGGTLYRELWELAQGRE
jgi:hypothetical protein